MIIYQQVQRVNGELRLIISAEDLEQLGLEEGQRVAVEIKPVSQDAMSPEIREAFERSWKRSEAAYRRLSGR